MLAILVTRKTRYTCNHDKNEDLNYYIIWMQSLSKGKKICLQCRKSFWSPPMRPKTPLEFFMMLSMIFRQKKIEKCSFTKSLRRKPQVDYSAAQLGRFLFLMTKILELYPLFFLKLDCTLSGHSKNQYICWNN